MTRILPFPKPTLFLDKPKARNTMVFFCVSGSFLVPSGLRFFVGSGFFGDGDALLECGYIDLVQVNVH